MYVCIIHFIILLREAGRAKSLRARAPAGACPASASGAHDSVRVHVNALVGRPDRAGGTCRAYLGLESSDLVLRVRDPP